MISEEMLSRLLGEAGSSYDVPRDGARAVVWAATAAAAPPRRRRVARPRAGVLAGVLALAVLGTAGGLAVGNGWSSGPSSTNSLATGAAGAGGPNVDTALKPIIPNRADTAGSAAGPSYSKLAPTAGPPAATGAAKPAPADAARIVKTGQVTLQVTKGMVEATMGKLSAVADAQGGYVASSHSDAGGITPSSGPGQPGPAPSGTLTLRVPADAFERTVTEVSALGTVAQVSKSGRDVTAAFVDNAARLHALAATRDSFLTLLAKANTIGDTLAVQQQITGVQQQIEQLQGQQKLLADQSDFATLDVTVGEPEPAAATASPPSGLHRAFSDAADGFTDGVESLIAVSGVILLVLIVVAGALALLWTAYRLLRRRLV